MKRRFKQIFVLAGVLALALALALPALAAEAPAGDAGETAQVQTEDNTVGLKSIAVGLAIGIAAGGGAIGMGLATAKSAEGKIRTMMMLGLVFIETAIIYALLVVILIIFVL